MVDITEISAIVAAAGVLVGVVYYILDRRQQMQIGQSARGRNAQVYDFASVTSRGSMK